MAATFHAAGSGGQNTSAASFSITCTISAGDGVVVFGSWDSASTTTPTVATTGGTGSDSFTLVYGPFTSGAFKYAGWLLQSAGTGRTGATVSWASSNPAFADGGCESFSGLTNVTLDKTGFATGTGSPAQSASTGTLSSTDEFAVGYAASSTTINASNAPWTDDGVIAINSSWIQHQVLTANTAIQTNFNASGTWITFALTFMAGATTAPFYKLDWGVQNDLLGLTPQAYVRNPLLYPNPIPFNDKCRPHTRQVRQFAPPQLLPLNLNIFKNPIPFKQTDWSPAKDLLPPPPKAPEQPRNLSLYAGVVVTAPFQQTNWPIPTLRKPSVAFAQSNTLINLLAQPLIAPDLSTSKFQASRAPDATQQTNINLFTNPIPFDQTDWPVVDKPLPAPPQTWPYNAALYTIQIVQTPFSQTDWSTTKFPALRAPDASQSRSINLFPDPTQFMLMDWSGSASSLRPRAPDLQPYNQAIYTVTAATAPFSQINWQTPLRLKLPIVPDQRSLNLNLFLNPIPFTPFDWSKTTFSAPARPDASLSLNLSLSVPAVPAPFISVDWSRPLHLFRPPTLSQAFNINLVTIVPPASGSDAWKSRMRMGIDMGM